MDSREQFERARAAPLGCHWDKVIGEYVQLWPEHQGDPDLDAQIRRYNEDFVLWQEARAALDSKPFYGLKAPEGATLFNKSNRLFYREVAGQPFQMWSNVSQCWIDVPSRSNYSAEGWQEVHTSQEIELPFLFPFYRQEVIAVLTAAGIKVKS